MAFCNSCGATLTPGTKFCNKCGAVAAGAPAAAPTSVAAPPSTGGGSSALKIILIVVGVIVLFGVIAVASIGFFAHRMITKNLHVTQEGDHVKVETPFGSAESSSDPAQAARDLNVDVYPGAKVNRNGATTATFGGVHSVTAQFESGDSLDKVCAFYKARFPNPMVTTSDQNRCTIISNDQKNMITINIEAHGDSSKIQITNVSKATTTGSSN